MLFKVSVPLLVLGMFACNIKEMLPPNDAADLDGDGIPDAIDPDKDGDGIIDTEDPDVDGGGSEKNYAVGGEVTGLKRLGLILTNNGGSPLEIQGNGPFTFVTRVKDGGTYSVGFAAQPLKQVCGVAGGEGTIAGADVKTAAVSCVDGFTVGGKLSGLVVDGTVTLKNNGGDDLVLSANGAFTFRTAMLDTQTFAVTVGAQSGDNMECNVVHGEGTIAAADETAIEVVCLQGAKPVLVTSSDWNTYYRYTKNAQNVLVPSACNGTEPGNYDRCLHGGEHKQVDIPGLTTCLPNAADELLAFDWECEITPTAVVRYSTIGLKPGKGLADLIDFATGTWRQNRLVINSGNGFIRTPFSTWWTNPIAMNATGAVETPGTIYAYDTNPARTFNIPLAGTRVAIVIKPDVTATGSPANDETLVTVTEAPFVWIEGNFDGASSDDNGISLVGSRYTVIHRTTVKRFSNRGISLTSSARGALLRDSGVGDISDEGIVISSTGFATLRRVTASYVGRNSGKSAVLLVGADNTVIEGLLVSNQVAPSGAAVRIESSKGVAITQLTLGQNQGDGLSLSDVEDATFAGVTVHDNAGTGIAVTGTAVRNRFMNTIVSRNDEGMVETHTGTSAELFDVAFISNTGTGLRYTNLTGVGPRGGLFIAEDNGTECDGTIAFDCTSNVTVSASPFVNEVGGTQTVMDWLTGLEHPLQTWGMADDTACTAITSCRKKDFSMASGDTVARGTVGVPLRTDVVKHFFLPTLATSLACSEQFPGSALDGSTQRCRAWILRASAEISGDAYGNDNGLCENGERCLFLQNVASDVGFGSLVEQTLSTAVGQDRVDPADYLRFGSNGR